MIKNGVGVSCGVVFFLVFDRDQPYLLGFAAMYAESTRVCPSLPECTCVCVRASGLFCFPGGLSDIKEDVHLGDVAYIRPVVEQIIINSGRGFAGENTDIVRPSTVLPFPRAAF